MSNRSYTRREILRLAGLGAASIIASHSIGCARQLSGKSAKAKPNIVFILADDLGWKDVGYHGGILKTPNIDKLAAEGTRLEQFYVQPVCSPTRASLMTGRYPMRYGLQVGVVRPWANYGLPLEERTLAQALEEAGYETAICGKWHIGHLDARYLPTARGFDHQYGHYNGALDYFTHMRDGGLDWHRDDKPLREEGYTTDLLANESIRLIEQHDTARPLFLYVPFNAVHSPYQAQKDYIDQYKDIQAKNKRIFAAMVTSMDSAVGRIIAALDKRGIRQNTLIFFCSDNGGVPNVSDNRPLRGHKAQLYEGGVRVPAIAVWPGVLTSGATVSQPLHMVDMYPTLIKLAGGALKQALPLDGKDAWPTIAEGKPSPHDEILLNVTPTNGAIRCGDWKLAWNAGVGANEAGEKPRQDVFELFNLAEDPYEKNDLSGKNPAKLEELKRRLKFYADQAAKANVPPNTKPDDFTVPKVWGIPD